MVKCYSIQALKSSEKTKKALKEVSTITKIQKARKVHWYDRVACIWTECKEMGCGFVDSAILPVACHSLDKELP